MKNILILISALLLTSLYAKADVIIDPIEYNIQEETEPVNVALKIGTLGIGLDVSRFIDENLATRFNLNTASYSDTTTDSDTEYDIDIDLLTVGILLDYYPFETEFRLSVGAYYNATKFAGIAKSNSGSVNIDGTDYLLSDLGALKSKVTFNKISPYIGIGTGNDARKEGIGFTFDLGVMYHGTPEVDLTVSNAGVVSQAQINAEIKSIEDDMSSFKFYPVIAIGINYTF